MEKSTSEDLPDEVKNALDRGRKIEAIKLLRKSRGLELKQAKDMIENHGKRSSDESVRPLRDPAAVADALKAGHRIQAIKLLREQTGLGLKEAKEAIDDMIQSGIGSEVYGVSPEKGRSKGLGWVIIAIAGLAVYYLFFKH